VIEGLARTAGLITSAAAIMIAVFTAFTLGSFWCSNAGFYAGRGGAHRRYIGADGCRASPVATCRRLELVALWLAWGSGNL